LLLLLLLLLLFAISVWAAGRMRSEYEDSDQDAIFSAGENVSHEPREVVCEQVELHIYVVSDIGSSDVGDFFCAAVVRKKKGGENISAWQFPAQKAGCDDMM
jgi:acyl-CoA synthetase (AMP-forming)/AMP-acid ligase II